MSDFKVGDHVQFPASRYVWDKGPNIDGHWIEWYDDNGHRVIGCAKVIEVTDGYVMTEGGMDRNDVQEAHHPRATMARRRVRPEVEVRP